MQLSAYSAMAEVVYDPMSGQGLRLPMLLGLSLSTIDATTEGTFQFQGNSFYAKNKTLPLLSPGIVAGIAPQESWGPIRFIPLCSGHVSLPQVRAAAPARKPQHRARCPPLWRIHQALNASA